MQSTTPVSQDVSAPPCVMSAPDANQWFAKEVHAHDGQLKAYLRGSFPSVRDVDDVAQESYLRIWKAKANRPIQSAKAFLFTIARHIAVDWVRREKISPVTAVGDLTALSVLEDGPGVVEAVNQQEKIILLGQAIAALPAKCRAIIILHKIKGLSQAEVAAELGLSRSTVENQVSRGVRRCEKFFREKGIDGF